MRTITIIPATTIGLLTEVKEVDESDRRTGGILDEKSKMLLFLLRTIAEEMNVEGVKSCLTQRLHVGERNN